MRPLLLVDSPGVGEGEGADQTALVNTAKLLKEFRQENTDPLADNFFLNKKNSAT
jgi:predicted GTPase